MLDAHPELAIPPETHFAPELIAAAGERRDADAARGDARPRTATGATWPRRATSCATACGARPALDAAGALRAFYGLYAEQQGKPRWGDKTPIYVDARCARSPDALPEARFVHLIRDGRDVALSRSTRARSGRAPAEKIAKTWRRRIRKAREQAGARLLHRAPLRGPRHRHRGVTAPGLRPHRAGLRPGDARYHEDAPERLAEMSRDLAGEGGDVRHSGEERMAAHALASSRRHSRADRRLARGDEPEDRAAFEDVAGDLLAELGYEVERR